MANSVYHINKGINKSIEFRGLKAQYIWYLGGGVIFLLIVFAAMYISGIPSLVCIAVVALAGMALVIKIYSLSNKYGEHGMMKAIARRSIPQRVTCHSRKIFIKH
ncbi:MAG: DUF4133 domain-containing protein [Chitinophagaceae bacterium]|nr:DUF4133 domain-containing protein [Chitinophagaceae bacterium]